MTELHTIPNQPDQDLPPTHAYEPTNTARATSQHRTPPHDLTAEKALLGAAMIGGAPALTTVPPDAFYAPGHGHIAQAITATADPTTGRADPVLVADWLAQHNLLTPSGGIGTLTQAIAECPSSTVAPHYARIVLDHWRARRLITTARELEHAVHTHGPDAAHQLIAPLLEHSLGTTDVPWEDVAEVLTGDYTPMQPEMLTRTDGQALIYPGLLHWLMGEPGKGKTWIALYITAEQIRAGHHVIYLDWEGNRQIIAERLTALGLQPDDLARLHYLRPPTLTRTLTEAIAAHTAEVGATIAICDGVAKALARNDLNEDKAADILRWLELVTHPLTEAGAAVLVLDHVTKDKDTRGLWPRGSGAKQGEVQGAAWVVKSKQPFSRHDPGEITLIQAKDREGHVGLDGDTVARILLTPQPGGRLNIDVLPPAPATNDFRPTHLMQLLSIEIERANTEGGHPNTNTLFRVVPGKKEHKQIALQRLTDEGLVTTHPGPRNAQLHTSVTPYRELDDPNSDKYRPPHADADEPTRWDDF